MATNFITVGECATLFGKSQKWVYQHQREIPGWFTVCGSIFFDRQILLAELEKLAKQSVKSATAISGSSHGL